MRRSVTSARANHLAPVFFIWDDKAEQWRYLFSAKEGKKSMMQLDWFQIKEFHRMTHTNPKFF